MPATEQHNQDTPESKRMPLYTVVDQTQGKLVADRVAVADTSLSRMAGLLGRQSLDTGEGLWIRPSSGVHTVGMKFTIDVIGLDSKLRVIKLWQQLVPNRLTSVSWSMRSVVELPAGAIQASAVRLGDTLRIERAASAQS